MKKIVIAFILLVNAEAALIGALMVDNAELQYKLDHAYMALSDPR